MLFEQLANLPVIPAQQLPPLVPRLRIAAGQQHAQHGLQLTDQFLLKIARPREAGEVDPKIREELEALGYMQ